MSDAKVGATAVKAAAVAVPAAVNAGLIASNAWIVGAAGPIGIAAGIVIASVLLIQSLDKSEERKKLAAERGQYEEANKELLMQNSALDAKLREIDSASASVNVQLRQNGLAGCDFLFFNCAYNEEQEKLTTAKGVYAQLQAENEFKRNRVMDFIKQFEELKKYLNVGLTRLNINAAAKAFLITLGLGAAGYAVYRITTK